jgi:hypothetical protein
MAEGMQIGVKQYKQTFFNYDAIGKLANAETMKELLREGAFIRTRMKSSIRYAPEPKEGERSKSSKPGSPPLGHRSRGFTRTTTNKKTGVSKTRDTSPLKELIFFGLDRSTMSVVTGPAMFQGKGGGGIAPRVLEKGGPAAIIEPIPRAVGVKASPRQAETFKRLVKAGRIVIPPRQYRVKTIRIAPRPYVRPAGEAESKAKKGKA